MSDTAAPAPKQPFAGWKMLAIASLAVFFTGPAQTYGVSVFVQPMTEELGISQSLFSSLYSIGTLTSALTLAVAGRAIDRVGSRRIMTLAAIVFGLALWIVGFVFQAGGDWQLRSFKQDAANKGKLLTTGLWSLTRHPNYFGESAMWWGIFLMAFNAWPQVWLAISPILITAALLKLSGVPLLEKQYQGRADWDAYAARTSMFLPMPPKRTDAQ